MNPRDGGDDFVSDSNNLTFGDADEEESPTPEQPQTEEEISEDYDEQGI